MNHQRQLLARAAKQQVVNIRRSEGIALNAPICIYELCQKLGVRVRFVDISMEGMYFQDAEPLIFISALRPFQRRAFTCAHELGHHVFGHGATIDHLTEEAEQAKDFHPNEFLADSFAGFMLMPILGIRKAFSSRGWKAHSATPEQFYIVACNFGVGYRTLITHMAYSLGEIDNAKAKELSRFEPKTIREKFFGRSSTSSLIVVDENWLMPTIDVEVGTEIILPTNSELSKKSIELIDKNRKGDVYKAVHPGIIRVFNPGTSWAAFIRVSRNQFIGLSQYRHLEEVIEDE